MQKICHNNYISIHAPTRGATLFSSIATKVALFQSTLPRGERLLSAQAAIKQQVFQSTLPRGERQLLANSETLIEQFQSTLPRGERRVPDRQRQFTFSISIHAPTRGATCPPDLCSHLQGISIHAPTRGATSMSLTQICIRSYFNPRSHEGSDATAAGTTIPSTVFQSTLPRGERREASASFSCR